VLPLLFFSIGGAAYGNYLMTNNLLTNVIASSGTTTIEIRGWKINSTNTMDANGNGFILGDELQIQEVKDADSLTEGLIICVNPIFPDWQLKLSVDVHNMAISTPVLLNTTIQYYDSNGILRDTDQPAYGTCLSSGLQAHGTIQRVTSYQTSQHTTCSPAEL